MQVHAGRGPALQAVGDASSDESSSVCLPYAKGGVDEASAVAVPCSKRAHTSAQHGPKATCGLFAGAEHTQEHSGKQGPAPHPHLAGVSPR